MNMNSANTEKWEKKIIDVGPVKVGTKLDIIFKATRPLEIENIKVGCTCTKYHYSNNTIEVKAITGAVKNPNLCKVLNVKALAAEFNAILDNRVEFEPRLTEDMLMTQFVNQGLIYPF